MHTQPKEITDLIEMQETMNMFLSRLTELVDEGAGIRALDLIKAQSNSIRVGYEIDTGDYKVSIILQYDCPVGREVKMDMSITPVLFSNPFGKPRVPVGEGQAVAVPSVLIARSMGKTELLFMRAEYSHKKSLEVHSHKTMLAVLSSLEQNNDNTRTSKQQHKDNKTTTTQ